MRTSTLLGSYVPGRTPVHSLDARVKLLALVALGVVLFASEAPYGLVMPAIAVIGSAFLAGLSSCDILRALRPSALLLAFGLLACAFVADGTADIVLVGRFGISCQGAARGLFAAVRIVVLIAGSLVMTTTTTPSEVADALSSLMAPLGILGLPVGDLAMLTSVALRFIPLAAEELERIHDAQRARGVDFAEGNPVVRVKRWLSVLTPLVVALFRRAEDLADAMRERGYRGHGRTCLTRTLRLTDIVVLVIVLAATLAACIA